MLIGSNIFFVEDGEEVFVFVEFILVGCLLLVFIFFGFDVVFVDFVGLLGVVFFSRDLLNRFDFILFKFWRK